ncbi:methyl-accepting chemotaxis protein [[Clostridium] fimetarium]|uniref:Methyl-accepting chemotaxis protein n=1 Tax=[Clostridium] fimetarium TaxID=99656 RepID=A0A1I0QAG4_9FIRM|nr:methyl-accepting chemotaxis protein [[Clostridium] fimetarium]SEW24008.1 methyl-accepting chemotaxis protein [[Clostridium] fimetarium]
MFNQTKKLEIIKNENYQKNLIERLNTLCTISDVYNQEKGDNGYLEASNELEEAINRLIKVKTNQVKALFLKNSEMIEYVTQMDYIKEMVDNIDTQRNSVQDVSSSSEQMSHAIEEVAIYVQDSLVTTNNTISMSTESLQTINKSFDYIYKSFDQITVVQNKMHTVVEETKEIENIVNIINDVAEQTNLLSLNASIEAARAGEKGKGFAVVADEIKKLAENTKESANYIRKMVKKLRDEIGISEDVIIGAVKIFSEGKNSIDEATSSMSKMEVALKSIGDSFDGISANIEEQTATTQEISARLAEINNQTSSLYDSCMQTGHGIYDFSELAEDSRNIGRPLFKDFHGNDMFIGMISEHLLWKWKVYNVVCGFIKIEEKSINEYTECTLGKLLEHLKSSNSNSPMIKLYEPHKNVHFYSKKIIRDVNNKDRSNIENDIKQLNANMAILLDGLKNAK